MIIGNLIAANAFSNVYLVAHERDIFFRGELQNSLQTLGINPGNLLYIGETKGQADTANEALRLLDLDANEPIVFHNADTILLNRDTEALREALESGRGAIDVFKADSPSYSYVSIEDNRILEIVEKRVISDWATSGLYGFPSGSVFQSYFTKFIESGIALKSGELYLSDIINMMLVENFGFEPLSLGLEGSSSTLVMGSPQEYQALQSSPSFSKHAS